jgi:hypothetical protein
VGNGIIMLVLINQARLSAIFQARIIIDATSERRDSAPDSICSATRQTKLIRDN